MFKLILKQKELFVTFDRYGIMRPTFVKTKLGVEEKKKWRTSPKWLHWVTNKNSYFSHSKIILNFFYQRIKIHGYLEFLYFILFFIFYLFYFLFFIFYLFYFLFFIFYLFYFLFFIYFLFYFLFLG